MSDNRVAARHILEAINRNGRAREVYVRRDGVPVHFPADGATKHPQSAILVGVYSGSADVNWIEEDLDYVLGMAMFRERSECAA